MAKTILLPETTFTAPSLDGVFTYIVDGLQINAESITVVFDGVKYENVSLRALEEGNEYGATYVGNTIDFSTYPFSIFSFVFDEGDPDQ